MAKFDLTPVLGLKKLGTNNINFSDDPNSTAHANNANLDAIDTAVAGLQVKTSINGITVLHGSVVPSAGDGVPATAPALYVKDDDGTVYSKTGSGDTAWSLLAFAG
jgi:hypothetical protein